MGVAGACMRIDVAEYDAAWTRVGGNTFKMDDSFFNPHDFGMTPNHYVFFQARRPRPRAPATDLSPAGARYLRMTCNPRPLLPLRTPRAPPALVDSVAPKPAAQPAQICHVVLVLARALACAQRAVVAPAAARQPRRRQRPRPPARRRAAAPRLAQA